MKSFFTKLSLTTAPLLLVGILLATPASAQLAEVIRGVDDTGAGSGTSIQDTVKIIVNILSWVVGIIAVIVIIVQGMRFILSSGDPAKVGSARNGIIYALVGLVVVVMAQVIVRFVLGFLS